MKKLFTSFLTFSGALLVVPLWALTTMTTLSGCGGNAAPTPNPASTTMATENIVIVGPNGQQLETATVTYPCVTGGGLFGGSNCTAPTVNLPPPPAPVATPTST